MRHPVGESIPRVDGREKVTGRAVYTGDITLPGMLHGKVLRSPVPHARIRRIDCTQAEALAGVMAVLTGETLQLASPNLGTQIRDQPVLARDKVRYAGDIVAAVAAIDEATAEEAAKRIVVEYEELPAVLSIEDALEDGAALVHDRLARSKEPSFGRGASSVVHEKSNICHHFRYQRGSVEEGFSVSDVVFEDTFFFHGAHHCPVEPHMSVACFDSESLRVWSAAQSPFPLQQEICRIFGLPDTFVRVMVPYVGGGFGGQKSRTTAVIAVALSRAARRPVRLAFSSDEGFKTICQPRMKVTIKTGLTSGGTFVARRCQVYLDSGAYANNSPSVTNKAGYRAHGPYRIAHVLTDAYDVYTNTVPAGSFRGFGAPQVAFAYESHMDMIAHRVGMDAVDLRMKNLLEKGEEYAPGDTPLDCDLKTGLTQLAAAIGWGERDRTPGHTGVRIGKGIACGMKDGGGTNKAAHAMVKILSDGSVCLFSGSVEIGQGVRTAFSQIVAQELTISPQDVQLAGIDTEHTPFDTGTHSSSSTTIMGQAVMRAARDAAAQLRSTAATLFRSEARDIRLRGGHVSCAGNEVSFQEVMRLRSGSEAEIVGRGSFEVSRDEDAPLGYPSPFWEIGLGAAEVEVDETSGNVRITKYLSMTDAGTIIHPLQCRGQDEGSVLFGIGQALSEELVYQHGRLVNGSLETYRLPRFSDVPETFSTQVLEQHGGPGPYGAKGVGEAALLAVAPAVANALYNATGSRLRELPLTSERIWSARASRGETSID